MGSMCRSLLPPSLCWGSPSLLRRDRCLWRAQESAGAALLLVLQNSSYLVENMVTKL